VAVVQYTFTHKQYTEYRERNIHSNKKKETKFEGKKIWWGIGEKIWRNKIGEKKLLPYVPFSPGHVLVLFPESRLGFKFLEVFGYYCLPFFKKSLHI
jgi:hypothetical protein